MNLVWSAEGARGRIVFDVFSLCLPPFFPSFCLLCTVLMRGNVACSQLQLSSFDCYPKNHIKAVFVFFPSRLSSLHQHIPVISWPRGHPLCPIWESQNQKGVSRSFRRHLSLLVVVTTPCWLGKPSLFGLCFKNLESGPRHMRWTLKIVNQYVLSV